MFMTGPGYLILLLLGLLALWLYVELASYPGKVARERGHPQADAINVLGWLGPLAAGVGWLVAIVWAHTTPPGGLCGVADGGPLAAAPQPEEVTSRNEDET